MYASESVNRLLVGNKSDASERHVTKEQGKVRMHTVRLRCALLNPVQQYADELKIPFFETSAVRFPPLETKPIYSAELCLQKDNVNVAEAFTKLAALIKDRLVGAQ